MSLGAGCQTQEDKPCKWDNLIGMKHLMPIFVICASAYVVYRLVKSGLEQPEEQRYLECLDMDGEQHWSIPLPDDT